jgi:ABC-type transport system involved in multi-copper enzyme maturation permease subunit
MLLLPVIERELRATARQAFTYHLRLLGVLSLVAVLVVFALHGDIGPHSGGQLFSGLHCALFVAIWLLVPLLTADCISRERREGTLPLLFLTPLKARDLVWAKGTVHGLRALSLWLAVLPVLSICLVAGGVNWAEVLLSVLVNFSALCLATAAGLTASSWTRTWTRAMALAMVLGAFFLFEFFRLIAVWVDLLVIPGSRGWNPVLPFSGPTRLVGFLLATDWGRTWQQLLGGPAPVRNHVIAAYLGFALCSLLVLLVLVRLAAWSVKHNWRQQPASLRVQRLRERFFKPAFFAGTLRRWLRWELRRNPIGWLERRSWSGRLVVWSWLAVVTCIYSSLFANLALYQRAFNSLQLLLAWLLAGSIALSAAGSFRRERESGVLELLLVSPLSEAQIVFGRVWGLWGQFLPSIALLCAVWIYCAGFMEVQGKWSSVAAALVMFATLPVVGLYFSLSRANFIAALLCTVGLHLVLPAVLGQVVEFTLEPPPSGLNPAEAASRAWWVPPGIQLLLALLLAWRMLEKLRHRKFALATK